MARLNDEQARAGQEAISLAEKIIKDLPDTMDPEIAMKGLLVAISFLIENYWRPEHWDEAIDDCHRLLDGIVFNRPDPSS